MGTGRVFLSMLLAAIHVLIFTTACARNGLHDSRYWAPESVVYATDAQIRIGGLELKERSIRDSLVRANTVTLYCEWVCGLGPSSKRDFSLDTPLAVHRRDGAAISGKLDEMRVVLLESIPRATWKRTSELALDSWTPSAVSSLCEIELGLASPQVEGVTQASGLYRVVVRLFYYWVNESMGGGEGVFRVGTFHERNVEWVLEFSPADGRAIVKLLDELVALT